MNTNLRWIVISDIHSAQKDYLSGESRKSLTKQIEKIKPIDFIIITGDCVDKCSGWDEAFKFIREIMEACGIDNPDRIFICPGNHDIERINNIEDRKNKILEFRNEKDKFLVNEHSINMLPWKDAYSNFEEKIYKPIKGVPYEPFNVFELQECRIILIDTCLCSIDDNDTGNLYVSFQEKSKIKIEDDEKLNIVIMHHGTSFLNRAEALTFQRWLVDNDVDIVFCGHNHVTGVSYLTESVSERRNAYSSPIQEFTCGACHVDKNDDNVNKTRPCFFSCDYNKVKQKIDITTYHYSESGEWMIDRGSLRSFHDGIHQYLLDWKLTNDNDVPIEIYENIEKAQPIINSILENDDEFIYYYGIKGDSIYQDYSGIDRIVRRHSDMIVKFLLVNPCSSIMGERLESIEKYRNEQWDLEDHWINSIYSKGQEAFSSQRRYGLWETRFQENPLVFRMYIMKNDIFINAYNPGIHAIDAKVYRYNAKSWHYETFLHYFIDAWNTAQEVNVPQERVDKHMYNFLAPPFCINPSLVINVTSKCNLDCVYCPPGGENCIENVDNVYPSNYKIENLMKIFSDTITKYGYTPVARITGGEPLLDETTIARTFDILKFAKRFNYGRIVLCTNGVNLLSTYNKHCNVWNEHKEQLLLKISLDTLKFPVFKKINRNKGTRRSYEGILESIKQLSKEGFKIELNTVLTKFNVQEIEELYKFAKRNNLIGVKIRVARSFGGKVNLSNLDVVHVSEQLENYLKESVDNHSLFRMESVYLNSNSGTKMQRFTDDEFRSHKSCILKIVGHPKPIRTFSKGICKSCKFSDKCETGIMSLVMKTNGILKVCDIYEPNDYTCVNELNLNDFDFTYSKDEMNFKVSLLNLMEHFRNCEHGYSLDNTIVHR